MYLINICSSRYKATNDSNNETECDYEPLCGSLNTQATNHLKKDIKRKVVRFD